MPQQRKELRRSVGGVALFVVSLGLVLSIERAGNADAGPAPSSPSPSTPDLVALAWMAEGDVSAADRHKAEQRLARHFAWMETNLPDQWGRWNLQRRGQWVFEAMHARLLTGQYQENQHALSRALLAGDYNCVSATMLYLILCDQAGLPTIPLQTRGHVWCRLLCSPELDIETTCPTWFLLEPHARTEAPAMQAGDGARALSDRGLVAKIPYNKATLAAAQGDYAAAVRWLNEALRFDPQDPAALKNRAVILNNWAVQCVSEHECEQALELLKEMETAAPGDPSLAENRWRIVDRVVDEWCRAGRFSDALRLRQWREETAKSAVPAEQNRHTVQSIYEQWIAQATDKGDWFEARNALRAALADLADDPLAAAQLRRQFRQLSPG